MKGLYMMATAALALTFAGCSKNDEPEDELKPEVHVGKVEVSSSQVVFPVDGGSKTIAVATNAEWHLDCDYTWMSFDADLNSGTVTISAEKNTTGADRYGVISVICGDEGYTDSRDIRVMQTYEPEDLVKDGVTANCYIAHTKASYRFPAKVKGNGAGDGNSKYIAAEGLEIKNAAFAELVWEAVPDGDKTRSTYVIDGEPMYDGEDIYFSTGKAAGNAVIAVCSADGTILWSWHIWVTDDEITTKTDKNGLVWMDRNLGAVALKFKDQNSYGYFYQWGRKDPMRAPASWDGTFSATTPELGESEQEIPVSEINGTIAASIANPRQFINTYPGGAGPKDWIYNTEHVDRWMDSQKTMFDPCPAGYKVPSDAQLVSFVEAAGLPGGSVKYSKDENAKAAYKPDDHVLETSLWSLPLCGMISYNDGTNIADCGSTARYASSTCSTDSKAYYCNINASAFNFANSATRGHASAVRCVKE